MSSPLPYENTSGFEMSTQQLSYRQLESDVGSMGAEGEESDRHISLAGTIINEPKSDPNVVDWDGPHDPENPLNWSSSKKNMHVIIVSLFSLAALVFHHLIYHEHGKDSYD